MAFETGFWAGGTEGSYQNMNLCLLGYGPYADFPAAAAGNKGALALATDRNIVYYSNGSSWEYSAIAPPASIVQGDLLYFNGTAWARLAPGTSGHVLKTNGAGANPAWGAETSIPSGVICMWSGLLANIPSGWYLCDGTNGTPNLIDKFVQGVATAATNPGATGGSKTPSLNTVNTGANLVGAGAVLVDTTAPTGFLWAGGTSGGGGSPLRNYLTDGRPPYYAVAFIMKG